MKKYILILIVLLFVGCKHQQRNDRIILTHNFIIPQILSFQLDTPILLADGHFEPYCQDSSKMVSLDREVSKQLLKITTDAYNEVYKDIHDKYGYMPLVDDSLSYDNTHFFIYGKLNLQPDVKSVVLWKFMRDFDFDQSHEKSFWLFNLKDNKVCSVVRLKIVWDVNIDAPSSVTTFLKDKIFITTSTESIYVSWLEDPIASTFNNHWKIIDNQFTHYYINEDGFVEFVKD